MKPNWFSLCVFIAVVGGIVCAHLAKIDALYTVLISAALPAISALMPSLVRKDGGS